MSSALNSCNALQNLVYSVGINLELRVSLLYLNSFSLE